MSRRSLEFDSEDHVVAMMIGYAITIIVAVAALVQIVMVHVVVVVVVMVLVDSRRHGSRR